ncbi:MAG: glycosyltransferase family 2 protein [Burkholderiales bacterium]|nr:glycosyltransferase family 2 protein [Burkholderiales bacterium]
MSSPPTVSVAICTHNRARYLELALASLVAQNPGAGEFEIVVIDNASTDRTREVAESFLPRLARLRYVHEPRLGLSHARNRALAEVRGRYIAYLDDDAVADPGWVEGIARVFAQIAPEPGCVGGAIEPIWERPRPDWLPDELVPYFTVTLWPGRPRFFNGNTEFVWGANMAFPVALLKEAGGFDARLGRIGDSLLSGEELLLQRQLVLRGHRLYYDPAIKVRHHVIADRVSPAWLYKRAYAQGLSEAVINRRLGRNGIFARLARAAWSLANLAVSPAELASLARGDAPGTDVASRCSAIARLGRVRGYLSAMAN